MKKLLLLLLVCMPFFMYSQKHVEFLGISLNENISSFSTKLKNKGFTPHYLNMELPKGERAFVGTFFGKKANVQVYYNVKNNIVYEARAIIDFNDRQSAKSFIMDILSGLDYKYGEGFYDEYNETDLSFNKSLVDRNFESENDGNIGWLVIGDVDVSLHYFSSYGVYTVYVDYTDLENYRQNRKGKIEDL